MAFLHGVYVHELPTALVAPRQVDSALPFVVGTAPIHLSGSGLDISDTSKQVNYPVLASNYEEAVTKLGYSDDWEKYSLCEFMDTYFQVFNVAPVIFVNVLDPAYHMTAVAQAAYAVADKQAILGEDVILDSVVVKAALEGDPLVLGTDYTLGWNRGAEAVVNVTSTSLTEVYAAFDKINPSLVTIADIVGGYNAISQRREGLELINDAFMKFGKVPSLICVPKWSENPEVAAVMTAKTEGISGLFPSLALTDIPSDAENGVEDYTEVSEWKRLNSYTDTHQVDFWPMAVLGSKRYHLSSIAAGVIASTDNDYAGVPYASPSNHLSKMTGAVTKSGKELLLDLNQVNLLNENGVCTLFNWESGWMLWGNECGCFPSNTDPKDRFINVRRFYNWWAVKFILTWFQKVDAPMNRRLLETIEDTENIQINAYVAMGALVGAENKIEFRAEDNPLTDLIDGVLKAHTVLTVPPPMRALENWLEYKAENLLALFL
jgi:phage tail sheath protein FI